MGDEPFDDGAQDGGLDDYYAAGYEPPFVSTVMRLEPDLPSLWVALEDAEDALGTEPDSTLRCRDLLAVVEREFDRVSAALDAEIAEWGIPPAEVLEDMERFGDGHHYPTGDLDVACGILDDVGQELGECRDRLDVLLGMLNRAQRRGAQAHIDAAFAAIVSGNVWEARSATADARRHALGALEAPEPAPPNEPVDLPRPTAELRVDALVAAAAAPPR